MQRNVLIVALLTLACDKPNSSATTAPQTNSTSSETAAAARVVETTTTRASKVPADGATTFTVYEAFLSPAQEPGEESEGPKRGELAATEPSTERAQRGSRGYGRIEFSKDLSKALLDIQITGVDAEDIVMFHIHCGSPGMLGPVIVDLGQVTKLGEAFADGQQVLEIANSDVVFVDHPPQGLKPHPPEGCPIDKGFLGQVKTIAGLEHLARKGVLYFNLHTKAHTYYGEMRGQIYAAQD